MRLLRTLVGSAVVAFFAAGASAHHSFARYYLDTEVELAGTVTALEWANPHVYLHVEVETEDGGSAVWQVEGQPPSVLKRFGWTSETFDVGDAVIVTGRPSRNDASNQALGVSVRKADGTSLTMNFNVPALADRGAPSSSTARDLSGTWLSILGSTNPGVPAQIVGGPRAWALTDKGQKAVEGFEQESMLPAAECTPYTAPFSMVIPDLKVIEIGDEVVAIGTEFEGVERIVHMNQTSHDGVDARPQGHSIGRWEGGTLVVDTMRFADHGSGNALGLPSGAGKHLVERFALNADGKSLNYSFRLEDPEYLAEPIDSGEIVWTYRPDLEYAPAECRRDNARRFIEGNAQQ